MTQRTEAKARTREALLDAALAVVAAQGYHGARLDAIAAAAGYSTGAVYASFEGKDELVEVLFDREVARFVTLLVEAGAPGTSVQQRISLLIEAYLAHLEQRQEFFVLAFDLASRSREGERQREFYLSRRAVLTNALAALLEESAREFGQELLHPATTIATIAEALGEGIALRVLVEPGSFQLADFNALLTDFVSSMVRTAE